MSTFHAVAWMDHNEAHVLMFDKEHVESSRIRSRSHHKHQGKDGVHAQYFPDVANALAGTHEVLLTGPGSAREEFQKWLAGHPGKVNVVGSVASDHPSDGQVVALARQYFLKFDQMGADPSKA